MSNYLALATVTATLQRRLFAAISEHLPGCEVTVLRPDAMVMAHGRLGLNIYLYRVTPNASETSSDVTAWDSPPPEPAVAQTAWNLRYLLTPFGEEKRLEPEKMLAITIVAMNKSPILSREEIERAVSEAPGEMLAGSDLAAQSPPVRVLPIPLSLDELQKLWTLFSPASYRLSMVYEASAVLLGPVSAG